MFDRSSGNPAPIIGDAAGTIGLESDGDIACMTGHRFIDRVVDDFVDQMMQRIDIGSADIHTGAFAHGFGTFKYLYGIRCVFATDG